MIQVEQHNGVLLATFNRPEVRNPLNREVLHRLLDLMDRAEAEGVRGLILTGTGDVFASGADLAEMSRFTPSDAEAYARLGARVLTRIALASFPVVACVNGPAVGGALELALAAPIRLATPTSFIAHPALRLGLLPAWMGATLWLANTLGRRYRLMLFTGRRIPAEEAHRLGIFHELLPAERLIPRAREILRSWKPA